MWPRRRQEPSATPKPGDLIAGKYRVERVLGVGGMGYVLAARHTKLDELVAIKMLRADVLRSEDDVARFLREGRACSKLKSKHVVRILDLGELPGGLPFLVMEQLEGRDLAAVLRDRGTLSVPQTLECVLEACEAVAEAHALGIVHRDLKPANLFLARSPDGTATVKVLDFGISKILEEAAEGDLSLTATRTLMGSPLYMAPEVMRSARAADHRSDVWALGCVLYELLAGVTPWNGETVTELCVRVLEETPKPFSHFRGDVPPELERIVQRCLAKRPEDRYQSVLELAVELATLAGRKGAEQLRVIERVVDAAEGRQRDRAGNSGPFSPVTDLAPMEGTLRGVGTTQQRPGTGRSRAILGVALAASVLALGVVTGFVLSRTGDEAVTATASIVASTAPPPAPSPSISAQPIESASAAPGPTPSAKPVSSKPIAPPPNGPAPGTKKPSGHAPKSSPYFDDPN